MFKLVSLFAGCGGFDLGFQGGFNHLGVKYEKLPFKTVWANDFDPDAFKVYKNNQNKFLGDHPVSTKDIRDVDISDIPDCDIITAGFPCQPFSSAGNRKGVNDDRGTLFEEVQRIIKAKKPKAFIIENVRGILSSKMDDGTPVTEEIRSQLSSFNYNGDKIEYTIPPAKLLDASKLGVPQKRMRVFIIGIRSDLSNFTDFNFENLYSSVKKESLQNLTVADVLKDIPKDSPNYDDVWNLSPQAKHMAKYIKKSWKDIPYEKLPDRFKKIRDNMKKYRSPNFYRRYQPDEINGTIIASAQPENCGIIHPHEDRRYTVREISRIQSFPDDFSFDGISTSGKYKVIGNAVPPVLAFVIASTLNKHLKQAMSNTSVKKSA